MQPQELSHKREKELIEDATALEEVIKSFWEILPIPACTTSPIFLILETGKSFDALFGFSKDELAGESLKDLAVDKDNFAKLLEKLSKEKKIFAAETCLGAKNGKCVFTLVSAIARVDSNGEVLNYLFSFQDITGRMSTEKELEEKVNKLKQYTSDLENTRRALLNILEDVGEERSRAEEEKERTAAIVKNFADGLFLIENNRVALVNPKVKELFSVQDKDILDKTVEQLAKNNNFVGLAKMLAKEKDIFSRKELAIADGRTFEISTTPVSKKGEEFGKMVIIHDVTREKFIEKMKTEFVSIAAHQLRTPISAIKWILRMMIDGDLGPVSKTQQEYLEKSYNSNERMIKLVNDLLNVTRIEEGRFLYDVKKEDFLVLAEKALAGFPSIAANKGLEFSFNKPQGKCPTLYLDGNKLSLALQNLVENAFNYTKEGKIEVSLSYDTSKKEFIFKIQDTGIGIPQDQQHRVFSRFFRAGNAVKAETSGTGLGLFISKNIIEAHRGKIWFESSPRGTTFYFTLPVKSKQELEKFFEGF